MLLLCTGTREMTEWGASQRPAGVQAREATQQVGLTTSTHSPLRMGRLRSTQAQRGRFIARFWALPILGALGLVHTTRPVR